MTDDSLLEALLAGDQRALARTISRIENREPGYRELVSQLYPHAGSSTVIGVTGSPGSGKSTLVDALVGGYRERGETVGVVAIDPSSPFSGGAILGDRIRMGTAVGDDGVFVRSMSARGSLGGLSAATVDAITAMDAAGLDVVIVETVGAGQNEVDVVRLADTIAVLVPPGSGDDVQALKAGILEIADVFVVNKADRTGVDRTVRTLREMIEVGRDAGRTGRGTYSFDGTEDPQDESSSPLWTPQIVETVATERTGLDELLEMLDDHHEHLMESGERARRRRRRHAETIRTLLREDLSRLVEDALDARGGVDHVAGAVADGETNPYAVADAVLDPLEECVASRRTESSAETDQ